jgi:hypothetical protein
MRAMHTLVVILIGLAGLWIAARIGDARGRPIDAIATFVWAWLALSIAHFAVGVLAAGYPAALEAQLHVLIFGIPAGAALWVLLRRSAG